MFVSISTRSSIADGSTASAIDEEALIRTNNGETDGHLITTFDENNILTYTRFWTSLETAQNWVIFVEQFGSTGTAKEIA